MKKVVPNNVRCKDKAIIVYKETNLFDIFMARWLGVVQTLIKTQFGYVLVAISY